MNTSRAICTLETMAIDMVGTLGGLNKTNPIAPVLERQIEAINMAQDALRAVRDFATDTNVGHKTEPCAWCKSEHEYTIIDDDFGQPLRPSMIHYCFNCGRKLREDANG